MYQTLHTVSYEIRRLCNMTHGVQSYNRILERVEKSNQLILDVIKKAFEQVSQLDNLLLDQNEMQRVEHEKFEKLRALKN